MKCSKCGAPEPPPAYHRPCSDRTCRLCHLGTFYHPCPGLLDGKEHLAYTCRCGYAWTTPTLDEDVPT